MVLTITVTATFSSTVTVYLTLLLWRMYYVGFEVPTDLAVDWMVRGLHPVRGRDFSLLQNIQTGSGTHPASYLMGTWYLSQGLKRSGCEVNHSPPCSGEVKNKWSCSSTHSVCLHGVKRENCTFFLRFSHWFAEDSGLVIHCAVKDCVVL